MSDLKFRLYPRDGSRAPYYQHDDRSNERTVKFKGGGNGGGGRKRGRGGNQQSTYFKRPDGRTRLDDDGDIQMSGDDFGRRPRFVPYEAKWGRGRRKNMNGGQAHFQKGNIDRNKSGWFRAVMLNIKGVESDFMVKALAQHTGISFIPYHFHLENNYSVFHLNDPVAAKAIERANGFVKTPNGSMLKVKVYNSPPPEFQNDVATLEKVKLAMSKRFNSETKALDLSSFAADNDLKQQGVLAALNRTNVLCCVMKIIEENIPQLQGLNISNNRLSADLMKLIAPKVKSIKSLNLASNFLRTINDLDSFKDVALEDLTLDGNPVCSTFNDQSTYIGAIRQRFPKVVRLDGQELPPSYGFDLEHETILPTSQGNFFVDENVRGIVPQFLEQYFGVYDSDDRQGLLHAYHDQAVFSICAVPFLKSYGSSGNGGQQFQIYLLESRNLLKGNPPRRQKKLHQGKLNIVSFLCGLPKTQHDPMSFSIDVVHVSSSLITFSCNGIFKEADNRPANAPIRSFSRVFNLTPQGGGFCIINESLFVTSATPEQTKLAFKAPAPTPSPSPVPIPVAPTQDQQQQMIILFAQQSGMNTLWSMKCLQENDWDFDKAAYIFQEYKKTGKIPPEAFENV